VRRYLKVGKSELAKSWNKGLPLLNRLLHSNLESLPKPAFESVVKRFTSVDYLYRADHRKLARVAELAQKCDRSPEMNRRLSKLLKSSVHNSFHYEVRAFAVQKEERKLEVLSSERLALIETLMKKDEIQG
jgi:hypothetical protein